MADKTIVAGILMDETTTISYVEVCQRCNISEEELYEMLEHGLVSQQEMQLNKFHIDAKIVARIQSACRLQNDLGINLPGVVLALELLDELEQIKGELSILQRLVR